MVPSNHPVGTPEARSVQPPPPLLVVDDDAGGSAATRVALVDGGYTVATECGGDEVLRLVRASLMRMVVSELYIPCGEGRCLVTALKQDRMRLPRLRVLVHTRHSTPHDLEWALAAGADTVVPKPARDGVLLREVGRLLGDGEAT